MLDQTAALPKPIVNIPLKDLLEYISEKHQVTVAIDEVGFKKLGIEKARDYPISLPRMAKVPLAFLVEAAAQQLGGTVKQVRGAVLITPGKRDLAAILRPAHDDVKKKLVGAIEIAKPVANAPVEELFQFLSERADVDVILADWLFVGVKGASAGKAADKGGPTPRIREVRCDLPADTRSLQKWLDLLAGKINATVVPRENVILIMPAMKGRP